MYTTSPSVHAFRFHLELELELPGLLVTNNVSNDMTNSWLPLRKFGIAYRFVTPGKLHYRNLDPEKLIAFL
jgi:hypothetical protein